MSTHGPCAWHQSFAVLEALFEMCIWTCAHPTCPSLLQVIERRVKPGIEVPEGAAPKPEDFEYYMHYFGCELSKQATPPSQHTFA